MIIRLIGLPTDINSSFERGPAQAPAAIRAALFSDRGNMAAESGCEIGIDIEIEDAGDLPLTEVTSQDDQLISAAVSSAIQADRIPLMLGGDHAVTLPCVAALAAHHGPLTIVHFDAHPDLYEDFEGNPRSHASPFARILEAGYAKNLIQIGIRTLNRACQAQVDRYGVEVIAMKHFTPNCLPPLKGPVYISLDLDGIDPAFAPGVSHPEPGGLTVREVLGVIHAIDAPIIGADIVEYNPNRDVGDVTAIVAAKFVREIASQIVQSHALHPSV